MKLINSSFQILDAPGYLKEEDIAKMIEIAGRTCYKSENRITEDSAEKFVKMLVESGHGAMLEHGTVYLIRPFYTRKKNLKEFAFKYRENPYSRVVFRYHDDMVYAHITTNYRVLVENNWLDDLKYVCEPTKYHERRISVRFICDRGVSHELVRHRVFSFAQESTRYCNYSKDKFNNELTFITPSWFDLKEKNKDEVEDAGVRVFLDTLIHAETAYMELLGKWDNRVVDRRYRTGFKGNPWTPQQARQVLPNALKTELVMTGTVEQWKGFFELRCSERAHPDVRKLALGLLEEFQERGYMDKIKLDK